MSEFHFQSEEDMGDQGVFPG